MKDKDYIYKHCQSCYRRGARTCGREVVSEEGEEPGMGSARTAVGVHDVALLVASDGMAPEAKAVRLPVTSGAVGLRAPIPCSSGMRVCKSQDLRHPGFRLAGGAAAYNKKKKI